MTCRNDGQRPWGFRRRVVVATLFFCAACVIFVMVFGSAGAGETIVSGCFTLAGAVIGSYIFGAVWNDKKGVMGYESQPEITNEHKGYTPGFEEGRGGSCPDHKS